MTIIASKLDIFQMFLNFQLFLTNNIGNSFNLLRYIALTIIIRN